MTPLTVTIRPGPQTTRLRATWGTNNLQARLPTQPHHPSALRDLLDALSTWTGRVAHVAICVGPRAPASSARTLWGGGLLPESTDRVRFSIVTASQLKRAHLPADPDGDRRAS